MMTPTSDERREVAARLREQLRHMRKNNCYAEDTNVVDCGNSTYRNIAWSVEPYGNFEKGNYVPIVERLADLIDPTCEVESVDSTGGLLAYNLSCGDTAFAVQRELRPSYCPNCGARVVSGDGE